MRCKPSIWSVFTILLILISPIAYTQDIQWDYPLDKFSRDVDPEGKLKCPDIPLVSYKGSIVRYSPAVTVHPAFKKKLTLFEQVVADVAIEIYGRPPKRIVQRGSYYCRRIRAIPSMISEHSLGNAIDVIGFDFGALKKDSELPDGIHKRLKRPFSVRLLKHWTSKTKIGSIHSRFLHLLTNKLVNKKEIFKVLLGPAYPGHKNHFHFDHADYTMISI